MAGYTLPGIEKLKGRENYDSWKFAVKSYLEHEELWDCVKGTEKDAAKITKARTKISLLVDPVNFVHVQAATTAKEAWDNLEKAFEDSGLTRKVGLLRKLITTRLHDTDSVEEYVNEIISTAHKLKSIKMDVDDEWIGTILLAGLPDEYRPMIMGLESSGVKIGADSIKAKLLQDVKYSKETENAALYSNKTDKNNKFYFQKRTPPYYLKNVRCYNCNKYGHYAKYCENKDESAALFSAFSVSDNENKFKDWILDSAATAHMTSDVNIFKDIKDISAQNILTADNNKMVAHKSGKVLLLASTGVNLELQDVLLVPELKVNLISVPEIVKKGYKVYFDGNGFRIMNKNKLIATGILENGLFKLKYDKLKNQMAFNITEMNDKLMWHRRLGHVSNCSLNKLKDGLVAGVNFNDDDIFCEICIKGKCTRLPFVKSLTCTEGVLNLVHTDICGPFEVKSFSGARYMLTFLDDFSHMVFVYFQKTKDETFLNFKKFKYYVENQTGVKLKILRSDNGGEFCNINFKNYLEENGIQHQLTVPYTPEQNGKAERLNRTIVEKTRCMLLDSNLPKIFWAEAANTAVYLLNISPTRCLNNEIPHQVWTGKKPTLDQLKVFGCRAYSHIPKEKRLKLDKKAKEAVMMGYDQTSKAYRLFDPIKRTIFISRDVIFNEKLKGPVLIQKSEEKADDLILVKFKEPDEIAVTENSNKESEESEENGAESNNNNDESTDNMDVSQYNNDESTDNMDISQQPLQSRKSERIKATPKKFNDYNMSFLVSDENIRGDPVSVEDAMNRSDADKWKNAMDEEYAALMENETWTMVPENINKKPLKNKWCFKTKIDGDGNITRYKARLVIKGYLQCKGEDYDEIYSPVLRYTSLRYLVALASERDLQIDQMDAVSAFLQGTLEEEIYMVQPECYGNEGTICKLNKSIYGLKQASRVWNQLLDKNLKLFGLLQSKVDQCVYYKIFNDVTLILAVYVDDILIFSNNNIEKEELKKKLKEKFKMKDFGEVKTILGIRISRNSEKKQIFLDQENYIKEILKKYNMEECNPVSTPNVIGQKLTKAMSPRNKEERQNMLKIPFREAIGSIMFVSQLTRPDISFALNDVSRFCEDPGPEHWSCLKRIIRYLKGTKEYKLCFNGKTDTDITGYTDADWANNQDDRRSVSGYIFIKCNGPISWKSKRQPTVALSTTEAEYMSLSTGTQEALWLKALQEELEQKEGPIKLLIDNQAAKNLAHNGGYQARTKHIDIRHHFLKEKINDNLIKVDYVPSNLQMADVLTKAVDKRKINEFFLKIGSCIE